MRNKVLTRIIAGTAAFALFMTGFSMLGNVKTVSAQDLEASPVTETMTETVLSTMYSGSVSMSAWDSKWVQCYDGSLSDWLADENCYLKVSLSDLGTFTGGDDKATACMDVLHYWGDVSSWFVFFKVDGKNYFPTSDATTETAYVYVPMSNFSLNDDSNGIGFNVQNGHVALTLDSVEIVCIEENTVETGETDETEDTEEKTVGLNGSLKFSDSTWWTSEAIDLADLIGDIDPDNVTEIEFYSDETAFFIGYNNVEGGWTQNRDAVSEITAEGILLSSFTDDEGKDHDPYLCVSLSKCDGKYYTVSWIVYVDEAVDEVKTVELYREAKVKETTEDKDTEDTKSDAAEDTAEDTATDTATDSKTSEVEADTTEVKETEATSTEAASTETATEAATEAEEETQDANAAVKVTRVAQYEEKVTSSTNKFSKTVTLNKKLDGTNKTASNLVQLPMSDFIEDGDTITSVTLNVTAPFAEAYWVGGGGSVGFNAGDPETWVQEDFAPESDSADTFTVTIDFNKGVSHTGDGEILQIGWWWGAGDILTVNTVTVNYTSATKVDTKTEKVLTGYKYYIVNEDGSLGEEITKDEYDAYRAKTGEVEADVVTGDVNSASVWMILAFAGAAVAASVFGATFRKKEEN